jgi:hypothetical protein
MSPTSLSSDADRFCQRPLVRRAYSGLVVGLAVFLLTLVVLREPFHGYLAEVRIDGPASGGLDLEAARAWLKAVDSQATVVTLPGGNTRLRSEIRITYRTHRCRQRPGPSRRSGGKAALSIHTGPVAGPSPQRDASDPASGRCRSRTGRRRPPEDRSPPGSAAGRSHREPPLPTGADGRVPKRRTRSGSPLPANGPPPPAAGGIAGRLGASPGKLHGGPPGSHSPPGTSLEARTAAS